MESAHERSKDSKAQRCAGNVLARERQADVVRADFVQALVHDVMGEFGTIALAAQMGEKQMAEFGGHDLFGGIGGGFIGQMTVAAENALFQTPGPAHAVLQHLDVVIGFQHQHIRGANAIQNEFGHVPEVGEETNIAGGRVQQETNGVLRVVRNVERIDPHVADVETLACFEHAALETDLQRPFDLIPGFTIAIDGDVELVGDAAESLDVIAMFVSDEDGGEIFRRAADAGQPLAYLAGAQSGIDEDTHFVGFQVGTVAGGTAAKNRQMNGHGPTLVRLNRVGNDFSLNFSRGPPITVATIRMKAAVSPESGSARPFTGKKS